MKSRQRCRGIALTANYESRTRPCRTRMERESAEQASGAWSGLAFYRKYTVALLRRYLRVSMQVGRVPSFLQRDVFCGRATSYKVRNFEDGVIFVQDVERCLRRLGDKPRELIERVVLQDYSQCEAAEQMGYSERHVARMLHESLDQLTDILLEHQMLELKNFVSMGG